MNVLIEMQTLCLTRPSSGADADSLARWYAAKARLHEHLAGEGGPDSGRERELAASARRHAQRLAGAKV
ncbi:hypothetical protein IU433_21360 [Nocardia puris]|uniref:Uncharacterized protein n=1 Tax=Nocardia puris TaxID=208602 RepID=A0A366DBC1_9NOCA|nr:hypothetical protein [Nocardia puris]MBF6214041.1 hypothetical protein [Nocardia puris]MBF6368675.1 hypothetical protein [Nocardia puris]MBF6461577.1 hypothetical protein [Nocardia puris]RBO86548.1 hypothetical protein DFR74_11391 [Nocardia puris]